MFHRLNFRNRVSNQAFIKNDIVSNVSYPISHHISAYHMNLLSPPAHQHYTRSSWQIEFVQAKSENKITRKKRDSSLLGRYGSSSFIYWKFINKCGIRWCQTAKRGEMIVYQMNYKCNSNSVIVDDSETKSPFLDAGWLTWVGKMVELYSKVYSIVYSVVYSLNHSGESYKKSLVDSNDYFDKLLIIWSLCKSGINNWAI